MTDNARSSVLDQIEKLSSAEDFFLYFLLPYEAEVVNVSRLHIMRRMGQYLAAADFSGMGDDAIFLEARRLLKRAYLDFIESTPGKEKLFKVFKTRPGGFVGLGDIAVAR
ncbi:nitrogenase stabilizing/protective protein NifW [Consotaella aegiceratis]|uniref:nitrogenase stabilizing/protective protein NifW n=1 Tax=Consotaella aegiceratis TaxID=3097961 RepID=UPI002F3E6414